MLIPIAAGVAVLAGAWSLRVYLRSRITPAEAERRRRAALTAAGKLGDGTLVDMHDKLLLYSYDVRGVTYTASQDVSGLEQSLPPGREAIFGPVLVKYDPKNPANSVVIGEQWSGFRNISHANKTGGEIRMKRLQLAIALCCAGALLTAGLLYAAAAAPTSILHVVTIKWKPDSTPEQRKAALDGVKKMGAEVPGISRVWIKATKVQPGDYNDAFVIEFRDRQAADAYADHPAHRAWEKIYLPIRQQSTSHQITN